jgi:hypothetical protein
MNVFTSSTSIYAMCAHSIGAATISATQRLGPAGS